MRDLDNTDREILRLLLEDGRRPWADIADRVSLSPPAVADRVERLREMGVVRGFMIELDRSRLRKGVEILVELATELGASERVRAAAAELKGVEHVFATAGGRVVLTGTFPGGDVDDLLADELPMDAVREYEVRLLTGSSWHPSLGDAHLGLPCAECENTVTSEGVTATLDGERYAFCCSSCRARFEERYERLAEGA
jgi:DNA-binding Lrp family transcriptional regulator